MSVRYGVFPKFQSTQPKRAATRHRALNACTMSFQSTQPKRAATKYSRENVYSYEISIHAAQEGCDNRTQARKCKSLLFQSTQPKRAATCFHKPISVSSKFQSTQPKRAATELGKPVEVVIYPFQSTQPKRAATVDRLVPAVLALFAISIHAAQEGCDSIRINCNYYSFYSYKSAKLTFLLN